MPFYRPGGSLLLAAIKVSKLEMRYMGEHPVEVAGAPSFNMFELGISWAANLGAVSLVMFFVASAK